MPRNLVRYQQTGSDLHFITFSCYRRQCCLGTPEARDLFERSLDSMRLRYGFWITGYVVMPEHVHLLVSEPPDILLSKAIQALKLSIAVRRSERPFWQARYYDFNVYSEKKRAEKLRYMHRNPVTRGLVRKPWDWPWSSFRHYLTGHKGRVEIESEWTAMRRERAAVESHISTRCGAPSVLTGGEF
jgi:putative transposase